MPRNDESYNSLIIKPIERFWKTNIEQNTLSCNKFSQSRGGLTRSWNYLYTCPRISNRHRFITQRSYIIIIIMIIAIIIGRCCVVVHMLRSCYFICTDKASVISLPWCTLGESQMIIRSMEAKESRGIYVAIFFRVSRKSKRVNREILLTQSHSSSENFCSLLYLSMRTAYMCYFLILLVLQTFICKKEIII